MRKIYDGKITMALCVTPTYKILQKKSHWRLCCILYTADGKKENGCIALKSGLIEKLVSLPLP